MYLHHMERPLKIMCVFPTSRKKWFALLSMSVFVCKCGPCFLWKQNTSNSWSFFWSSFQVGVMWWLLEASKNPEMSLCVSAMLHRAGVSWHLMVCIFMFLEKKTHKSKSVVFVDVKNQSCRVKQSCGGCYFKLPCQTTSNMLAAWVCCPVEDTNWGPIEDISSCDTVDGRNPAPVDR